MEWIMTFHILGIIIIPTDELHHFSVGLVETTNQLLYAIILSNGKKKGH